jgi:hypothetical protein
MGVAYSSSSYIPSPTNHLRGLPYEVVVEDNITKVLAEELRKSSEEDCEALIKMWKVVEEG